MPLRSRMAEEVALDAVQALAQTGDDRRLALAGRRQAFEPAVQVLGRLHHVLGEFLHGVLAGLVHLAMRRGRARWPFRPRRASSGPSSPPAPPPVRRCGRWRPASPAPASAARSDGWRRCCWPGDRGSLARFHCSWRDQLGCMSVRRTSGVRGRQRCAVSIAANVKRRFTGVRLAGQRRRAGCAARRKRGIAAGKRQPAPDGQAPDRSRHRTSVLSTSAKRQDAAAPDRAADRVDRSRSAAYPDRRQTVPASSPSAMPATPLSHQQHVGGLRHPERRHDRTLVLRAIQQRVEFGCRFVLEAPGDRDRTIQNEAGHRQRRPASRSSRQSMPPSVAPRRNATEALHRLGSSLLLAHRLGRHQTGYRPAAPSDHQFLTALDPIQQLGKMGLGLEGADLIHGCDHISNQFIKLVYSGQMVDQSSGISPAAGRSPAPCSPPPG